MLPFIVVAQLAAAPLASATLAVTAGAPAPGALHALVARAVERNRAVPASLLEYRARMESEIAVLKGRADGEEGAISLEQSQNEVRWRRGGDFSQHLTAYRARQAGPSLSALAVLRKSWAIPMLYGNAFEGFFGKGGGPASGSPDDAKSRPDDDGAAIHPFGPEGERVYEFSGGDTVAVIGSERRTIHVVRVMVEPRRAQATWPVVVFRGEINLDAERGEIVRMRGQFVTLERGGPQQKRLLILPVRVMAFVDLESVEIDGRYWLPSYQRIEMHVDVPALAEGKSVFRIVSRFRGHAVKWNDPSGVVAGAANDGAATAVAPSEAATTVPSLHRLTMAAGDTLERPADWWRPIGEATAALRGSDFSDAGAAGVDSTGAPRFSWRAQRLADVMRFNRIEGWSTGVTAEYTPGAAAPGVTLRANAMWAWEERAVRGRLEADRRFDDGRWRAGVRLARTLDITNDFTAPSDSGGALVAALAGIDDYDYVDRRSATLLVDVTLLPRRATMRVELGAGDDRKTVARMVGGPLGSAEPFRPNRGVDEGAYVRSAVQAEWNPMVNAGGLATGVGAILRSEVAAGRLDWQRTTVRVNARADRGSMAYALRLDGGILASRNAPPQQLFELGGGPAFPGYEYKEFAGDRALAAHARALYRLPVLRAPLRMLGCTCFPSPAPELALTLHGATVSASGAATQASVARLGSKGDVVGAIPAPPGRRLPLARATDGVRSSVEAGVRVFGGAVTVAMARALEAGAQWRMVVLLGQAW